MVDTGLTEFQNDRIRVVLQKGYILYVLKGTFRLTESHLVNPKFGQYGSYVYDGQLNN